MNDPLAPPRAAPRAEPRPLVPEKRYFKIGEVAELVGVEPHVLRYWETQFSQLRPHKARSGHRLYRRREVELLLVVRELLHVQRFTIAGARQALRQPGGWSALMPRFFAEPGSVQHTSEEALEAGGEEVEVEVVALEPAELEHALAEQAIAQESAGAAARKTQETTPIRSLPGAPPRSKEQLGLLRAALDDAHAILAILDGEPGAVRLRA